MGGGEAGQRGRKTKKGESAKEEERKRSRRMYQCLRAAGGLPGGSPRSDH